MAVIGKIRKRGGLITIVIGLALAAFVLGDLWKTSDKGKRTNNVGEILGEKITNASFEAKVNDQIEIMKQQSGMENISSAQTFQIREEVWKKMVRDIILGKEYEELGIDVSANELSDMLTGKEPHQYILQNFSDPQTGQFNPAQVSMFMQRLDEYEQQKPGTKDQWENLLETIKSDRLYNKYLNLIKGGYYVPKALVQRDYEQKNKKAVIRFFVDKYSTIADNTINPSQEDFQKYYDAHKHEYELIQATRDLDYVTFDINPSKEDLKRAEEDINKIRTDIEKQVDKDIPNFVNRNSDSNYDSTFHKKGSLPINLDTIIFAHKKGDIIGPLFNDYTYTIAKVMNFQLRADSMKASHILISYAGAIETAKRTKENAKKMADSLLTVIKKNPKTFDTLAKTISDDNTAKEKAGDLGWFTDGAMVGPFNEACINGKEGEIKLVETNFGFHLIKITGKKQPVNKVQVAIITRIVEPSQETNQTIYSAASTFAGTNTTQDQFNKAIVSNKLNKKTAEYLAPMSDAIAGLESPREIIRWAFEENTKKGDVSKVFELEDKFVVACVKEVREKGIPSLDQIKTQLEPLVKREKKAENLVKKISALKTAGISIDQLAEKVNAKVDTLDMLTFASYAIPGYGFEPEIIGSLFTMKKGSMSEPLKGKNGVFVIFVDNFVDAPAITDYNAIRNQIIMMFKNRGIDYDIYNALEKNTKITDNRSIFF